MGAAIAAPTRHTSMPFDNPSTSSFLSQRLRLSYVDWGNESAPPAVLIHGGRDHARNWDAVARHLQDHFHVLAPDLRGHGDSAWTSDGHYPMSGFVQDLAEFIHQLGLEDVILVGHSLGGNISLRYTGLFPETVRKLVAIEGLGPSPKVLADYAAIDLGDRLRKIIADRRAIAGRTPKRYPSLEAATARMQAANSFLSREQAEHLTLHGTIRHEDGSYGWKFDPYLHLFSAPEGDQHEVNELFGRITCPTKLVYGAESWASNPMDDGRINYFGENAEVVLMEGAGHWPHHDHLKDFLTLLDDFL